MFVPAKSPRCFLAFLKIANSKQIRMPGNGALISKEPLPTAIPMKIDMMR